MFAGKLTKSGKASTGTTTHSAAIEQCRLTLCPAAPVERDGYPAPVRGSHPPRKPAARDG
jgi:hypothetical protein